MLSGWAAIRGPPRKMQSTHAPTKRTGEGDTRTLSKAERLKETAVWGKKTRAPRKERCSRGIRVQKRILKVTESGQGTRGAWEEKMQLWHTFCATLGEATASTKAGSNGRPVSEDSRSFEGSECRMSGRLCRTLGDLAPAAVYMAYKKERR